MTKVAHCETTRSYLADKVVLIVDDEASIRKTLGGILSDEGISVVTAPDGETALLKVKEIQPHLVLLDIWMPGMDGLETLAKIKDLSPNTPVVMISGHANISTALAATKLVRNSWRRSQHQGARHLRLSNAWQPTVGACCNCGSLE